MLIKAHQSTLPDPDGPLLTSLDPQKLPRTRTEDRYDGTGTLTFWEAGIAFRHAGWKDDRSHVLNALERAAVPAARMDAFTHCGANAWVLRDATNPSNLRISCDFCHDRFCRPCANARSHRAGCNLAKYLKDEPHRFLTLTLRSHEEPLKELLDRLQKHFTRLRRTSLWRHAVAGGAAFLEITYNADKKSWHPHLHCIVSGKFIKQSELADLWHLITGDSCIVHIRLINNAAATVAYVTKYASKPLSHTFLRDPDRLLEAVRALAGRKMIACFGAWRAYKLTEAPEPGEWLPVLPLAAVLKGAAAGDAEMLAILKSLNKEHRWHIAQTIPDPPDCALPSPSQSQFATVRPGARSAAMS